MSTEHTSVNVTIVDPESSDHYDCGLSWAIEEKDNGGSLDYELYETYYARLFVGRDVTILNIVGTLGSVSESGTRIGEVEENISFSGSKVSSVSYTPTGQVTFSSIGTIFNSMGVLLPSLPSLSVQGTTVTSSTSIYGTIKASYNAKYTSVTFGSSEYGTMTLIAIGICNGELVSDTISVTFSKSGGDEPEEEEDEPACNLKIEIESEDNNGSSTYEVGKTYIARVYKGGPHGRIIALNTLGSINLKEEGLKTQIGDLSSSNSDDKIHATFTGSNTASLPYTFSNDLSTSASGTFYNESGSAIGTPSFRASEDTLTASTECFGSVELQYTTKYDTYSFRGDSTGEAVLGVSTGCGSNTINSSITVTFSEDGTDIGGSGSEKVSVTLVYKDFVSGNVIPGATFYLDGVRKGVTGDSGEITLDNLDSGTVYAIKATKEGYLDTDSDSLTNDEFIVNT